jgi:LacI family transcriptional regulator
LATIYDVAADAGVSIKTVSRVMNGEAAVRPETRDRVLAAATALNYHPNRSARSLAGSKSFLVVALVDANLTLEHWRNERGNAYLARIQLGATMPCREAGYHFLVEICWRHCARTGLS